MPINTRTVSLICASLLLGAAAPSRPAPGAPVTMQSNPRTQADATARRLSADDLEAAKSRGDTPLVLTGRAVLGGAQPALFVQLQSTQECGSAGCSTSVFSFERGRWQRVLDGATGRLTVSAKKTRGRNDVLSEDDHFVWNGTAYVSLDPAPNLNLRAPAGGRRYPASGSSRSAPHIRSSP